MLTVTSLARALDAAYQRIQFTRDLLPADLLGTSIYQPQNGAFTVRRGSIFAAFLLADEIDRAPPEVQGALLEAMQEGQVTIRGEIHPLPQRARPLARPRAVGPAPGAGSAPAAPPPARAHGQRGRTRPGGGGPGRSARRSRRRAHVDPQHRRGRRRGRWRAGGRQSSTRARRARAPHKLVSACAGRPPSASLRGNAGVPPCPQPPCRCRSRATAWSSCPSNPCAFRPSRARPGAAVWAGR